MTRRECRWCRATENFTTDATLVFKFKIKGGRVIGSYELTFTGRDDSGRQQTAQVTLVIEAG